MTQEEEMVMVRAIAGDLKGKLQENAEYDDLVQAGYVGLLSSKLAFAPYSKASFATFARHRIRGAMLDFVRGKDWATKTQRRWLNTISRLTELNGGQRPSDDVLASHFGVSITAFRRCMAGLPAHGINSLSPRHPDDIVFDPVCPDPSPEELCARSELRDRLLRLLKSLPERSRYIINRYFTDEVSSKVIASEIGIHESRVSQIIQESLDLLRRKFAHAR